MISYEKIAGKTLGRRPASVNTSCSLKNPGSLLFLRYSIKRQLHKLNIIGIGNMPDHYYCEGPGPSVESFEPSENVIISRSSWGAATGTRQANTSRGTYSTKAGYLWALGFQLWEPGFKPWSQRISLWIGVSNILIPTLQQAPPSLGGLRILKRPRRWRKSNPLDWVVS